ncbi:MAG: hypothetical protein R3B13_18315 [Polyangiaceae bacterium]
MRLRNVASCLFTIALVSACISEDHRLGSGGQGVGASGAAGSAGTAGAGAAPGGSGSGGAGGDPCAGLTLPDCPEQCAANAFAECGMPCANEGAACGNEIGDGMTCTGGTWQCTVHPPLGPGCNLVCRPAADPCAGVTLPDCPAECPSDYTALCGQPCLQEGAACGNEIGDGMTCTGGTWQCTVHPPLGKGCNLVCRRDQSDPCVGQSLPTCPPQCSPGSTANCGQPCNVEGEECGNNIGDGMTCTGGTWQCTVHPPLGQGCNLVCRDLPG